MKSVLLLTLITIFLQASIFADDKGAIIPGKSIDSVAIGQSLEDVERSLGVSPDGDTSMGHLTESWKLDGGKILEVFCKRPDQHAFTVWKVRTTSPRYTLSNGIHVGSSVNEIKKAFPSAIALPRLAGVLEDAKTGISFELEGGGASSSCIAIAVYSPVASDVSNSPVHQAPAGDAQATNTPIIPVLSGSSRFASIGQFEKSAREFEPSKEKNSWGYLFSAAEVGQPDDSETGTIVVASHISDIKSVWVNDDLAVVFITADPPTQATRSEVGVVLLLTRAQNERRISDYLKYRAMGHYANVTCDLATNVGSGYRLDQASDVFLTITITQGGRGMSHVEYQTLRLLNDKLFRYIP